MLFAAKLAVNRAQREMLLSRSHDLRVRIAQDAQVLEGPLSLADRVRSGFQWLASHPQWLLVPVALTVVLQPRRVLGWALKGWWGWRFFRRVQRFLPR